MDAIDVLIKYWGHTQFRLKQKEIINQVIDKKDIGRSREPFSSSHTKEIVSMTSGGISKFFNIQNQKFIVITCGKCAFSEFYRTDVKAWENIIDFFGN